LQCAWRAHQRTGFINAQHVGVLPRRLC
jgi:hypothetical protein